jgi:hypothetical protein
VCCTNTLLPCSIEHEHAFSVFYRTRFWCVIASPKNTPFCPRIQHGKTVLCVLRTHYVFLKHASVFFEHTFQRTHQIYKHVKYRTRLSNNTLIARTRHACNTSINVKPLKMHLENMTCIKKKYIYNN